MTILIKIISILMIATGLMILYIMFTDKDYVPMGMDFMAPPVLIIGGLIIFFLN